MPTNKATFQKIRDLLEAGKIKQARKLLEGVYTFNYNQNIEPWQEKIKVQTLTEISSVIHYHQLGFHDLVSDNTLTQELADQLNVWAEGLNDALAVTLDSIKDQKLIRSYFSSVNDAKFKNGHCVLAVPILLWFSWQGKDTPDQLVFTYEFDYGD